MTTNSQLPFRASLICLLAIALSQQTLAQRYDGQSQRPKAAPASQEMPKIPPPDAAAAAVPRGFKAELVLTNLHYPTSIEFDDEGRMYIAEAGFAYGDDAAPARVTRITFGQTRNTSRVVADQLSAPVNDIMWHRGRLYISHRGKISVLDAPHRVRDLVTGLPSEGDHHNNSLAVGPDGRIYFGQGTATNSGVVGQDNFMFGWLKKHPRVHDVPAYDITLRDRVFEDYDPFALLTQKRAQVVATRAFQPFGRATITRTALRLTSAGTEEVRQPAPGEFLVRGQTKASGTILRMDPDGSNLEVFAWGLRNPFGLGFDRQGSLYVTDAGYDERGSRPIANAPDCLWKIRKGAWYGFPDYVAGIPVTDPRFRPSRGPAPRFLMVEHPRVEKPVATLPPHTGGAKFALSPGGEFGRSQIYLAMAGDMTPATGAPNRHPGYSVARIDVATKEVVPFLRARRDALGPAGFEYVATAGPKRPVDVKFSPAGSSLYVVDLGAMAVVQTAAGPAPHPFPGTGAVWKVTPVLE